MTNSPSERTVHHPDVEADPSKASPVIIPGPVEEVAQAIDAISPEGRPAYAKIGPGGMHWLVAVAGMVILITSVAVGLLISPTTGLVMFLVGGVAFVLSPGFFVAFARAHEREEVAKTMSDRNEPHPAVVHVKDPSEPRPTPAQP